MHTCIDPSTTSKASYELELANNGSLGDGGAVDEDADAVGDELRVAAGADGKDEDVSARLVAEDDRLGLLDGQPHHLRPRRLLLRRTHRDRLIGCSGSEDYCLRASSC